MLLVFRSMLPPSHWQNKAAQCAAWLLFFTNSHASAFRNSCTHLEVCIQHPSCNTHSINRNTHTETHTKSRTVLHRAHSVLHPLSQPSSCRHKTLSFPPTPLFSTLLYHLIASPPVSLCPPLPTFFSSPASQLSSSVKRRLTPPLLVLFYCFVKQRERGRR